MLQSTHPDRLSHKEIIRGMQQSPREKEIEEIFVGLLGQEALGTSGIKCLMG